MRSPRGAGSRLTLAAPGQAKRLSKQSLAKKAETSLPTDPQQQRQEPVLKCGANIGTIFFLPLNVTVSTGAVSHCSVSPVSIELYVGFSFFLLLVFVTLFVLCL